MRIRLLIALISISYSITYAQKVGKDTCVVRIESISNSKKQANEYDLASEMAWKRGEYNLALDYADRGLKLCVNGEFASVKSKLLNNKGIAYDYLGNYSSALIDYFKALEIQEKLDDPKTEAYILSNIGLIYSNQRLSDKALSYQKRALELRKNLDDTHGLSASLNNIAIIYVQKKEYQKAADYYLQCIKIDKELNDIRGLGDAYNNLGICYMDMKDFSKSEDYMFMSLEIREQSNDPLGLADTYANLGTLYSNMGEFSKAREYFLLAVPIAKRIGSKEALAYVYSHLYTVSDTIKDIPAAYEFHKLYIQYRDSVQNSNHAREQTELELQYNFKKEKEVTRLEQERKEENARIILYSVSCGLLLILIFSVLLFRRWKVTQGQKKIIEDRNKLVERKNEEILDSITYAKRIQNAILPSNNVVKKHLANSFIIYKPKDIVAGDFYWVEQKDGKILFAAADCTGHGVPGAMVSVVCNNALNRSVREHGLTIPGKILDKTREIVVQEFEKSSEDVKDGMDIALCSLDNDELQFSGANNPLWIIRNGELLETKGDKQPIGNYDRQEKYRTHVYQLQEGDTIYIFTDGYVDQFGGEKGKKFMAKSFRELLLGIQDKSMEEQKQIIEKSFEDWKGGHEQVDDVCVFGVKI